MYRIQSFLTFRSFNVNNTRKILILFVIGNNTLGEQLDFLSLQRRDWRVTQFSILCNGLPFASPRAVWQV